MHCINDGTKRHHVAFMACEMALEFTSNVKSVATPQGHLLFTVTL